MSTQVRDVRQRVESFCRRFELRVPILLAPMAGASPPSLSIAVAKAGGLGACGALLMSPEDIIGWSHMVRTAGTGAFQINNWIPGPPSRRDFEHEAALCTFLAQWGPDVKPDAAAAVFPSFDAQCEAMLAAHPPVISSIMGLFPEPYVRQLKEAGIAWFATVSTVAEARRAEAAGADVVVAQGMEAGGHRGCFDADAAETQLVGLVALLPAIADTVRIPVVAAGGVGDARGIAAAFLLGASAVQIGTGFLRCPEAQVHPAWAAALGAFAPEDTILSRVFSGRAGRSVATDYVRAATARGAPAPAPYPIQRALTAPMRRAALREGDLQRMQAWAGQSAHLAQAVPAGQLLDRLWLEAQRLLSSAWG